MVADVTVVTSSGGRDGVNGGGIFALGGEAGGGWGGVRGRVEGEGVEARERWR